MGKILIMVVSMVLTAAGPAAQPPKAVDPANMDTSVKACENYYQYADGGWVKANPVPADKGSRGSFAQLADPITLFRLTGQVPQSNLNGLQDS